MLRPARNLWLTGGLANWARYLDWYLGRDEALPDVSVRAEEAARAGRGAADLRRPEPGSASWDGAQTLRRLLAPASGGRRDINVTSLSQRLRELAESPGVLKGLAGLAEVAGSLDAATDGGASALGGAVDLVLSRRRTTGAPGDGVAVVRVDTALSGIFGHQLWLGLVEGGATGPVRRRRFRQGRALCRCSERRCTAARSGRDASERPAGGHDCPAGTAR